MVFFILIIGIEIIRIQYRMNVQTEFFLLNLKKADFASLSRSLRISWVKTTGVTVKTIRHARKPPDTTARKG